MLECNVVRDLLPNYMDELVSEKTAQEMEEHFVVCNECKSACERMKTPLSPMMASDEKDIDYLKKVKSKSRHKVIEYSSIVVLVLITLFGLCLYFFARGKPANAADIQYSAYLLDSKTVRVEMSLENGENFHLNTSVAYNIDGQLKEFTLSPRLVPERFGNGNYFSYEYRPDNGLSDDFHIVIKLQEEDIILTAADFQ